MRQRIGRIVGVVVLGSAIAWALAKTGGKLTTYRLMGEETVDAIVKEAVDDLKTSADARKHEVTVFEAEDRIGGHTHTVPVEVNGEQHAIDTGFIVFNEWTYPHFIRLLDELGVASQPTEMSFSVHEPCSGDEYNGNNLNSLFARRRNLLSPRFWGMLRDILRFNREALRDLQDQRIAADITLGAYLQQGRYGKRFIAHYIVPMGSAIWSMSLADMLDFPLQFFVRFFRNHGLLSVSDRPQWRVVSGGSASYLAPLSAGFADNIRLNSPVYLVERDLAGVVLHSTAGPERFDSVVFACHSDQALQMLAMPTPAEREILGAMRYADNDVVLHTDTALLPDRPLARASWNYRLGGLDSQPAAVTYCMNILQGIQSDTTFCVSLNQTSSIDPRTILGRYRYAEDDAVPFLPDDGGMTTTALGTLPEILAECGAAILLLRGEILNTRVSHLDRVRPQTPLYRHSRMRQGHTHLGQILGASSGYGGSHARLALDLYHPGGRWGAALIRSRRLVPVPPGSVSSTPGQDQDVPTAAVIKLLVWLKLAKNVKVLTFKDVNVEELQESEVKPPPHP